ncbi:hypothetical protein [Sporomusa sp. KB1]|jgi:methyltransferase-like protein|uniref:hypothetical protein n=1 Tax=Sporomusa sp. KB1 TaxID=943346 RepID=UPI0011A1F248|nr:hypothetical protein [Sporomusa sp. KB1]TWH48482.1 hypothetical protein Salpa_4644 [Sporomusa sp. KB1]
MVNYENIAEVISLYWPDEYEICGKENVKNIIEDVLSGNAAPENFASTGLGHDFDISIDLTTVLAAAQLIVAVIQCVKENGSDKSRIEVIIKESMDKNGKYLRTIEYKPKDNFIETLIKMVIKK